jgi:hypothetical protein
MIWEKVKEKFFRARLNLSFKEYLEHATYFIGVNVRDYESDLSFKISYDDSKDENPFKNNSMLSILEIADRCAAHEAGELMYGYCQKIIGERQHRVLGEFVGEYFAKVLRKKIREHPISFVEQPEGVYQIANQLVFKISERPFREQILFLQKILFGKPPNEIETLIGNLDELDSRFPYEH